MNVRFLPTLPQASSSPNSCYAARLASHVSTRYPFRTLLVVYILPILALVFLLIDRSFRVDDPIFSDYFLRDHERTRRYDARDAVHHLFEKEVNDASSHNIFLRNRQRIFPDTSLSFVLLFRMPSKSDNILTPRHIASMKRAEDIVFEDDKFPRMCLRKPSDLETCITPPCTLPTSIISSPTFYAYSDSKGQICRESGYALLAQEKITQFVHNLDQSSRYAPCLGRSAFTENTTWIVASYFIVGVPFGINQSEVLSTNEMYDIYAEWITNLLPILSKSTEPHFETFVFGPQLTRIRVGHAITKDTVFAAVALGVVAMFIVAHTSSLFLAIMTALQVFFSIPISLIIYWYIFNIPFFSVLQVFAIYLLVGIAADDVFVFTDAWKQSFVVLSSQDDLYTRMVWTYSRAVAAMTVTTVTTAFAFLLLLTSPIMPIATLGAWAALIITVQFILVITAYPCVLVLWQRYFRNRSHLGFGRVNCCSPLSRLFRQPPPVLSSHDDHVGSEDVGNSSLTPASTPNNPSRTVTSLNEVVTGRYERSINRGGTLSSGTAAENTGRPPQSVADNYRFVEQFFRDRWITVLFKIRYILVACAVAMLITCTVLACLLKTSEREDRPLRQYNPNEVALRHIREELPTTQENDFLEVRLTWGILDISHQGSNYYDRDEVGEPIMDKTFDLKPKKAQDFLLETCRNIRERTELILKDTEHDRASRCWIEDFSDWRSTYQGKQEFETFENDESLAVQILSFANHTVNGELPYMKYIEEKDVILSLKTLKVLATELRFLSRQKWRSPLEENQAEYKRWENVTNELNQNGPPSMNNCFATSGYPWIFAITQETLLFSMRPGIGIMLTIAFVIMCIATGNLTIAVLTTCAVGGVLGIVFAFLYIVGWDLGVAECLSAVISVGYAFDGVAHIGKAYAESDEGSQEQRTRDGLTALGISVLFGTLSTATSALILLFTQVLMLFKFGVLVTVTMAATLLWALVFLPAGLLVFGPCKKDQWLRQFTQRMWRACNACGNSNENASTDDATATPDNDLGESQGKQCDDAVSHSDQTLADVPCGTNEKHGDEIEIRVNPL